MEEVPKITRNEIDYGLMRREALTLVNSIRSSLFTSHGVRKDVKLILYPLEPKQRMIRIDGEKLRFMGPDERSISILLSMSAERLISGRAGEEVSSPGVTIINKNKYQVGINDDMLIINQSSDGSDLRRVQFTGNMTYICALDREWRFGDIRSFVEESPIPAIALNSASRTDLTILMMNNEIDRQLEHNHIVT